MGPEQLDLRILGANPGEFGMRFTDPVARMAVPPANPADSVIPAHTKIS
jgi:hypothetical protein